MRDDITGSAPADVTPAVIHSIALPLAVIDRESRIVTANQAFARLSGAAAAELHRRLLPDLAAALWRLDEPLRSLLAASRNFRFEHRTAGRNPRLLSIQGHVLPGGLLLVSVEDLTTEERLRELVGRLLRAQEDERHTLSRELHDDISQRLARVEMDGDELEHTLSADPEANRQRIRELRERIGAVSTVVRATSHRLYPLILEDLGLGYALRSLVDDFRDREQMSANYFEENYADDVPEHTAIVLYRLVEDGLRSAAEQEGTTAVAVTLQGGRERLLLEILAHGYETADEGAELALVAMEQRARAVGATLRIESAVDGAVRIVVDLPGA